MITELLMTAALALTSPQTSEANNSYEKNEAQLQLIAGKKVRIAGKKVRIAGKKVRIAGKKVRIAGKKVRIAGKKGKNGARI